MANPLQSLNENFVYNSMLARALLQLLPDKDKTNIQIWLHKLHEMDETADEMSTRNEYMWFLLLQLQNKRITQPFRRTPPTHKLRPLKDILPTHVYEEVLTSTEQNMSWLDQVNENKDVSATDKSEPPSSPPAYFLQNQPTPKSGVICYMAAFSDQDY